MDLQSTQQMIVVPIFYRVNPSDVRHQRGSFATAFDNYEDHLVKMALCLNMESEDEVRVVGIWGMGGVGKTTIAKCVYDRFLYQCEYSFACWFMEDVQKISRAYGLRHLQKELLSGILHEDTSWYRFWSMEVGSQEIKKRLRYKKVFLVLDGVDEVEQLLALAKDTTWFGPRSRIIITTRDRGLLHYYGVNKIYEVKCLDDKAALQVFKQLSFKGRPPAGHEQLLIRASRLAHGLPSALVVYATHLSALTTINEWEYELGLLETTPDKHVQEILSASYNALDPYDKTVFLHVACLFNSGHLRYIIAFLNNGDSRIKRLAAKSLIDISSDGCINMHHLLVQTGREIVRQESNCSPSEQRFLWDHNEIYDVLDSNTGTKRIECMSLHTCDMPAILHVRNNVFGPMHNLTFLKFFQHSSGNASNLQHLSDDGFLSRNLKLLHWDAYPLRILPSIFRPHTVIELSLRYNKLNSLWDDSKLLPKLRILDVTGSRNLRDLPELSTAVNLEELIIEGCTSLVRIPESINRLHLRKLNMIHCDGTEGDILVTDLHKVTPNHWGLKQIILTIPISRVTLNSLTDLSIQGKITIKLSGLSGIVDHLCFNFMQQKAPQSVTHLPNSDFYGLKSLDIERFSYMNDLGYFSCLTFANFPWLTKLKLINLNIQDIPEDICHLLLLETLDLSGNGFVYIPNTMGKLSMLNYLSLHSCRKLKELPQLSQVKRLRLSDCVNLESLTGILGVENPPGRNQLLELRLENCNSLEMFSEELRPFTNLTYLDLSRLEFETIPTSIREFSFIRTLRLNNCKKLRVLEELPQSLKYLYVHGCESLKHVSFSKIHSIKHFDLSHCFSLDQKQELITEFIHEGDIQEEVTSRFVCLPESQNPCCFDNHAQGTSTRINLPPIWAAPKLVGFIAYIMVACESSIHLQFPAFSYNWNRETKSIFRINLKPNLYLSSKIKEDKFVVRSHHIIIIQVPRSIDNEEIDVLRLKSTLQIPEDLEFSSCEIISCGVRLIARDISPENLNFGRQIPPKAAVKRVDPSPSDSLYTEQLNLFNSGGVGR